MGYHWYALSVKPHKEQFVNRQLRQRSLETYLPAVGETQTKPRAFFPGYLFVRADLEQIGRKTLDWLPGARGVVAFGDDPVEVPTSVIDTLRRRLAHLTDSQARSAGLQHGDPVRITSGPLTGFEAIFDRSLSAGDRVQVLLALLSRYPHAIQLDATTIEPAPL